MQGLQYLSLTEKDIELLSQPMSRAYRANIYSSPVNINHAHVGDSDCINLLQKSLFDPACLCFKVIFGADAIAAVVIHWNEFAESELRHMFIAPKFQNKGIGRRVWSFLQGCYPTQSWRVDVPSSIERNIHFYKDICGFKLVAQNNGLSTFVWQGDLQQTSERTNDTENLFTL